MGRRGSVRGRSGCLFIVVFAACLAIFFLTWRSLMSQDSKVKDGFSKQKFLDESDKFKDIVHVDGDGGPNTQYDIRSSSQSSGTIRKKDTVSASAEYEQSDIKSESAQNSIVTKPQSPVPNLIDTQALQIESGIFYRQPNKLIFETISSMERLVHLDLKGAAPKMSYLISFIPLIKTLGATGLLIEYEDMFPYGGVLESLRAKNSYSLEDIKELLMTCESLKLKVMPLVQTFGHMEFALKSEFSKLREIHYTPQVIDMTQNASYALISEMIDQILNAHPGITHLHIGCDEVYELGKGASAGEMQRKKLTESQIFLQHVQHVSNIVRGHAGTNIIPVMWDDELRNMKVIDLENSKLPSLVEIMVWQHSTNIAQHISMDIWDKYAKVFKSVWIASAFKGATGPRQMLAEPAYHVQNHLSWLDVIAANNHHIHFKGVAITGEQRYDHFATLCELLPVAIPSLAMCLATLQNAGFTKEIHLVASKLIKCESPVEMTIPKTGWKFKNVAIHQDCRFPGHELYYSVQALYMYTVSNVESTSVLEGWLSDYQIAHGFSNPGQLKALRKSLAKLSADYAMLSIPLRRNMALIYSEDTVEEWMDENVEEKIRYIKQLQKKVKSLQHNKSWPQRPLQMSTDNYRNSSRLFGQNEDQRSTQYENKQSVSTQSENKQSVPQTIHDKLQDIEGESLKLQSISKDNVSSPGQQSVQDQQQRNPDNNEMPQQILSTSQTQAGENEQEKLSEKRSVKNSYGASLKKNRANGKEEGILNGNQLSKQIVSDQQKDQFSVESKSNQDLEKVYKAMKQNDALNGDEEKSSGVISQSVDQILNTTQTTLLADFVSTSENLQSSEDIKIKGKQYEIALKNEKLENERSQFNSEYHLSAHHKRNSSNILQNSNTEAKSNQEISAGGDEAMASSNDSKPNIITNEHEQDRINKKSEIKMGL